MGDEHIAIHNCGWEEVKPEDRKIMHLQWHMDHFQTVYNRCLDLEKGIETLKVLTWVIIMLQLYIAFFT